MIEFLTANWLWLLFIVTIVAMHRGGGCGSNGHANHGNRSGADRPSGGDRDEHAGHR